MSNYLRIDSRDAGVRGNVSAQSSIARSAIGDHVPLIGELSNLISLPFEVITEKQYGVIVES
jgi:hypothetical protein